MNNIISRRAFLKVAVVGTGAAITQACAPEPLKPSNIIPSLTPTHLKPTRTLAPESTSEPLPQLEATAWAAKEHGGIDAEKLYQFVGDWKLTDQQGVLLESSGRRSVDLMWGGMRLVYTGDQDVQKKGFDQNTYRNQIADLLNKSEKLKQKLSVIKEKLRGQNLYKESMVVVINGPDFSGGNATLRSDLSDANPDVTGIVDNNSTVQSWYIINEDHGNELVRLSSEEEPNLLPPLLVQNGKFIRTDTGAEVMMRGYHYGSDYRFWFAVENELKEAKEYGAANFIAFDLDINGISNQTSMQRLSKILAYVRNRLGFRIVVTTGWKGNDALQVDNTIADNWRSLLEYQDENDIFLNGNNFGVLAERTIDVCSLRSEPNDKSTVFNPNYKTAVDEVRRILGINTIVGLTPGNWFGDSPPEFIGESKPYVALSESNIAKWNASYQNDVVAIHPYYIDSYDDPGGQGRINYEELTGRRDPRSYIKELKNRGVAFLITESGSDDVYQSYHWLMGNHPDDPKYDPNFPKEINGVETTDGIYDYFEKNKISYITDDMLLLTTLRKRYPPQDESSKNSPP